MALKGGSKTKGGLYWKKSEWEIVTVEGKQGTLPGAEDTEYVRIPGTLFAPLALILGLAFYLFLPLIGFAMVFSVLGKKAWSWIAPRTHEPPHGGQRTDTRALPHTSRAAHIHTGGGMS
ncbi:MAG TPA: hypothetical protein VJW77_09135 [Terriglobia bacterium]|nr:hypothetical protein [Terriglobia bacterium]